MLALSAIESLPFTLGDAHVFVQDVCDRALAQGESRASFCLGGRRLQIFFDPADADWILHAPEEAIGFFFRDPLVDWLGEGAPLLAQGLTHTLGRRITMEQVRRLASPRALRTLAPLLRNSMDSVRGKLTADMLGDTLLRWACSECVLPYEPVHRWLWAADTPALVVPWLRYNPLSRWRSVASARWALNGVDDAVLSALAGLYDNPAILALEAIHLQLQSESDRSSEELVRAATLLRPPVPLILRETRRELYIHGELLPKGTGLAVRAKPPLSFGAGRHECPGAALGHRIAVMAVDAARHAGLIPLWVRRRRRRLSYGADVLGCRR